MPDSHFHTHLRLARHLNASIKEFVEIIAELSGGCSQLPTLAAGGVYHLPSRLVQVGCCLVQFTLGFLERLCAWRQLQEQKAHPVGSSLCVGGIEGGIVERDSPGMHLSH